MPESFENNQAGEPFDENSISNEVQNTPLEQPTLAKPRKHTLKVIGIVTGSIVCVCVLALAVFGAISALNFYNGITTRQSGDMAENPYKGLALNSKPQTDEEKSTTFAAFSSEAAAQKALPSVVTIKVKISMMGETLSGVGSGIIMEKDGYIITNAHVVDYADTIKVVLDGGKGDYKAEIVGVDRRTDLAVIKIDAENIGLELTPAEMGNSADVKVGERILIIGTPQSEDFAGSVTQGIISGLNRSVSSGNTLYSGAIQVDAAINRGNSGGALVNSYGQVIGINSAKLIDIGTEGLGFSIPISDAKPIIDDLMNHGKVMGRVCLGITAHEVTEEMARIKRMPVGLYVEALREGSNLSEKGVLIGDVITELDGKAVASFKDVKDAIKGKKAEDSIKLKINRYNTDTNENEFLDITAALIEDEDEPNLMDLYKDLFPDGKGGEDESKDIEEIPPETDVLRSPEQVLAL